MCLNQFLRGFSDCRAFPREMGRRRDMSLYWIVDTSRVNSSAVIIIYEFVATLVCIKTLLIPLCELWRGMFWSVVQGKQSGGCASGDRESEKRNSVWTRKKAKNIPSTGDTQEASPQTHLRGNSWSRTKLWTEGDGGRTGNLWLSSRNARRIVTELLISHKNQDILTTRSAGCRRVGTVSWDDSGKSSNPRTSDSYLLPGKGDGGWNPPVEIYDTGEFTASGSRRVKRVWKRVNGDSIEWQDAIK